MMAHVVFEQAIEPVVEPAAIAFLTPKTPCEQAWADLCDEIENERVETVIACLGGWEHMIETPITFRDFTAAYYDTEDGALCSCKRRGAR
jgi:hypothetical protein